MRSPATFAFLLIAGAVLLQAIIFPLREHAQSAPRNVPVATQSNTAGTNSPRQMELPPIGHQDTYRLFIEEVGISEANREVAIQRNESPVPARRHFSECLGLSAVADLIIYPILTGAFHNIEAAEQVVNDEIVPNQLLSQERAKKLGPLFDASSQKEATIVKEAMDLLQLKLSHADFNKLDAYIFDFEQGGKPFSALQSRDSCSDNCNPAACWPPSDAQRQRLGLVRPNSSAATPGCLVGSQTSDAVSGPQGAAPVWTQAKDASGQPVVGIEERHEKVTCEAGFKELIWSVGGHDLDIQERAARGKPPVMPRVPFSKALSIQPESEDTIHAILMDGAERLVSSRNRFKADFAALRKGGYSREQLAKMDQRIKARDSEEVTIVKDTMARLRQELPEGDLETFDHYVALRGNIGGEQVIQRRALGTVGNGNSIRDSSDQK